MLFGTNIIRGPVANHKKSESYKAVLNFFRNTLGYDRRLIGQLVRYAVDRIARAELDKYLLSNRWLDKIGGRKELNSLVIEAIRAELRSSSADWIDRQLSIVRSAQDNQVEVRTVLSDIRSMVGAGELDYDKLVSHLDRLEELL